jgi:hypothetical protein
MGRFTFTPMGMPQKEDYENRIFWRDELTSFGMSSVLFQLTFCSNQHPRKPIPTFQTPSIDRLHGHLGLPFRDHDSQIAVTLGTGALEVFGHSISSRSQALVHHDPGNLKPEPFRQFFDAYGELLELKAGNLHD